MRAKTNCQQPLYFLFAKTMFCLLICLQKRCFANTCLQYNLCKQFVYKMLLQALLCKVLFACVFFVFFSFCNTLFAFFVLQRFVHVSESAGPLFTMVAAPTSWEHNEALNKTCKYWSWTHTVGAATMVMLNQNTWSYVSMIEPRWCWADMGVFFG